MLNVINVYFFLSFSSPFDFFLCFPCLFFLFFSLLFFISYDQLKSWWISSGFGGLGVFFAKRFKTSDYNRNVKQKYIRSSIPANKSDNSESQWFMLIFYQNTNFCLNSVQMFYRIEKIWGILATLCRLPSFITDVLTGTLSLAWN